MRKRWLLLSLAALYALGFSAFLSSKTPMVLDEFFAFNLLSDPSLTYAISSWQQGADSGGILYYLLLWPLVQLTHHSVLTARLFSAACYMLAGTVWWRTLSRFLDSHSAALGVLLVWLSTGLLLLYSADIRFYTPLLLFASLAVWSTLRCSQPDVPPLQAALLLFTAHSGLVLIHMLGILYSGLLLAASLLCLVPRKRSLLVGASIVASWLTLLPCHNAIRNGSANATSQAVPVFRDLLRFYLKSSANPLILLLAFAGLVLAIRALLPRSTSAQTRARLSFIGPVLCLAFLASPASLYLLSRFGRPLGAARYLLPYYLSLCTLCAYTVARLRSIQNGRFSVLVSTLSLLLAAALHLWAIRTFPPPTTLSIGGLGQLANGRPVVVADEQTFFQLQYYRSSPDLQFHFLVPPVQGRPIGMMATIAAQGYFPESFQHTDDFERTHPDFVFIASSIPGSVPWVTRDPSCHARQISAVTIGGVQDAVYQVSGCQPHPL